MSDIKNLKTRYLIWLYKTTKEELDRIDRKFTQLEVDGVIFNKLKPAFNKLPKSQKEAYKKYLADWSGYIKNKKIDAEQLKFEKTGEIKPNYLFLRIKLSAIESAIKKLIGRSQLNQIRLLYHQEMLKRILEERQHK